MARRHNKPRQSPAGCHLETLDLLLSRADELASWRVAFAPGADLLLYGCGEAAEGQGQQFVDTIARLTGADVSASNDLTGAVEQGGDWQLEYHQGDAQRDVVPSAALQANHGGTLVTSTVDSLTSALDLTTGVTVGGSFDGLGKLSAPQDLTFSNGGTRLLVGDVTDRVYALLGGLTEFTMESRFSATNGATDHTIFSYETPAVSNAMDLSINDTGELVFGIQSTFQTLTGIDYAAALLDGNEHTVSVSWTNSGGNAAIYIDSLEIVTFTGFGNSAQIGNQVAAALVVGQNHGVVNGSFATNDVFSGTLHDLRVFSDVRTANEVAASYRCDLLYDEAGMIAHWQFSQPSGDGVVIETVSGNNPTVSHTSEVGFTASEASLTFSLDENASDGTLVGQVSSVDAECDAQIASLGLVKQLPVSFGRPCILPCCVVRRLNSWLFALLTPCRTGARTTKKDRLFFHKPLLVADSVLRYSAVSGKFYKKVDSAAFRSDAKTAADSTGLNSVNGQVATVRSAVENELVRQIANTISGDSVWMGGADSAVEGEWRWVDGEIWCEANVPGNSGHRTSAASDPDNRDVNHG